MNIQVCWDMTPCCDVSGSWLFKGMYCLLLQRSRCSTRVPNMGWIEINRYEFTPKHLPHFHCWLGPPFWPVTYQWHNAYISPLSTMAFCWGLLTVEDGGNTVLWNVKKQTPSDTSQITWIHMEVLCSLKHWYLPTRLLKVNSIFTHITHNQVHHHTTL